MSKRITPFASQNTVAITLAADLCTLNFLVTGEDGCFQVMESRFVSGVFRWTQVLCFSSDFHLFGLLKRHLGGMAFETEDDLISELRN
ncbi:hypothetical protein PoB_004996100 [Plakobranchus ocellatus]|uniref:Uncharacterized protein n=1 Tax=Plakobranchus ocellatus TaxID=259542 RepID=A0AAV4BJD5_9GAST|nr:hypothetical protein PoB_004996100 [Plakobranchus ocellatus]